MMPHHDATEFPEPTYKEATEGWQRCQAEVARLQTALEGAEARDRLRGEALNVLYGQVVGAKLREHIRAAIDITPDEAREKEEKP